MAKINFDFNDADKVETYKPSSNEVYDANKPEYKLSNYPYFTGEQFPDIVEAVLTYMEEEGGDNFDELQTACRAVFADADVVPLINIITKVFEVHKYAVLRDFHLVENQEGQKLVNQELYKQQETIKMILNVANKSINAYNQLKIALADVAYKYKDVTVNAEKNVFIKECFHCGTHFESERADKKYCSAQCQKAAGNKRHRDRSKLA